MHSRADGLNKFLEYATSKDNVFLVTVSQVLDWMKNPGEGSRNQLQVGDQALVKTTIVPPVHSTLQPLNSQ